MISYSTCRPLLALALGIGFTGAAHAQGTTDAIRYGSAGSTVGARALGMGGAFSAVADDYSATLSNPAGLGQIKRFEFTGGLGYHSLSNNARYLRSDSTQDVTSTEANAFGIVIPFPTYRGSLVAAAGYNRVASFDRQVLFDAYNSTSSIVPYLVSDSYFFDLARQTFLADSTFDANGVLSYRAAAGQGQVQQNLDLVEDGGLNRWSLAGAAEAAPGLFVGATLNIVSGSFSQRSVYKEDDIYNVYRETSNQILNDDFAALTLSETIQDDISGFDAKIGLLYQMPRFGRLGLTLQTPQLLTVDETVNTTLDAYYDADVTRPLRSDPEVLNVSYNLHTPWALGAGLSFTPTPFLTLALDADARDHSQLSFKSSDTFTLDAAEERNSRIKRQLRSTINYRVGVEGTIPNTSFRLRAGYGVQPSPYKTAPYNTGDYSRKTLSLGAGLLLAETLSVDLAYSRLSYTEALQNYPYDIAPDITQDIQRSGVLMTVSYRFGL